jgi:hypothetical protein
MTRRFWPGFCASLRRLAYAETSHDKQLIASLALTLAYLTYVLVQRA